MDGDLTVEVIKQLPLAVVAILACIALWRAYTKRVDDHIADLRDGKKDADEQRNREVADLRARTMVIEDNLHIDRKARLHYLPTVKMPGGESEMKDIELD